VPVDLEKFTKHLRENALPGFGAGHCAKFVREALQAAGATVPLPYPVSGKYFGPTLERLGFQEIDVGNPDKFSFRSGDVMMMDPTIRGHIHGHVAAYDGTAWISDHVQTDFWAGPAYRKERPCYAVYRY
jgi:hypothetical protein